MASTVMITDENMILQVANKLKEYGEMTYLMVAHIDLSLSRKRKIAVHTDGWPEFTTVFVELIMPNFINDSSHLFTTDRTECRNFLLKVINPEWTCKSYRAIGPDALAALIQVVTESQIIHEIGPKLHLFHLKKEWLPKDRLSLPPGYHETSLRSDDIPLLMAEWRFGRKDSDEYVKYVIGNFPSTCVRDADGQLIGWMLQHAAGSLGMLHVMSAHRRRGIAKYLVTTLSEKILQDNVHAYVNIEEGNLPSTKLHELCGFVKTSSTSRHLYTFGRDNQQDTRRELA